MSAWAVAAAKRMPASAAADSRSMLPFMVPPCFLVVSRCIRMNESWPQASAALPCCEAGFPLTSDGLGVLAEKGRQAPRHGVAVDVPGDEDQAGAPIGIRPGLELHRWMEQMLHAVDGDGAIRAGDVQHALDAQQIGAMERDHHLDPVGEAIPVQRAAARHAEGADVVVMAVPVETAVMPVIRVMIVVIIGRG